MTYLSDATAPFLVDSALCTTPYIGLEQFGSMAGWEDAATLWPLSYDVAFATMGRLTAQATHPDDYGGENDPNLRVGHTFIGRDLGISDNFRVGIEWIITPANPFSAVDQVSPCAFIDFNAADPEQMGVMCISDISIIATYLMNAFRNPVGQVLDPAVQGSLGGNEGGGIADSGNARQRYDMTCINGELTYRFNGVVRGSPVAVPAWATGRTKFGVHIISIDWVDTYPGGTPVLAPSPALVDRWYVEAL